MRRFAPLAILTSLILVALTLVACAEDGPSPGSEGSGVRGVVTLGPLCPVATLEDPCPDRVLAGMRVQVLLGDDEVATVTSGDDGRFEVALAPGDYTLLALPEDEGMGFAKPVSVTVPAEGFAEALVSVDTGIRGPSQSGIG